MTLALFAFAGALPQAIIEALAAPPVLCVMEGAEPDLPDTSGALSFRPETLGTLIQELQARGIRELCFAGAMRRPTLDPSRIDAATAPLVPKLMAAMGQGDDGTLRAVLALFEGAGFQIRGAHEIAPALLPPAGTTGPDVTQDTERDAARAEQVMSVLSAADVGQACVVAKGQVIAVETAPGTDWMLGTLQKLPTGVSCKGGTLFKAPKANQDRRIDLPVIGPDTLRGAAAAGLSAVVIKADGVMVLAQSECADLARELGISLWVRP